MLISKMDSCIILSDIYHQVTNLSQIFDMPSISGSFHTNVFKCSITNFLGYGNMYPKGTFKESKNRKFVLKKVIFKLSRNWI